MLKVLSRPARDKSEKCRWAATRSVAVRQAVLVPYLRRRRVWAGKGQSGQVPLNRRHQARGQAALALDHQNIMHSQ